MEPTSDSDSASKSISIDSPPSTSSSLTFDPPPSDDLGTIDFDISIPELIQFKKELEETKEMLQNIQSWKVNLENILSIHGIEIPVGVKLTETKLEDEDESFRPLIINVESLASFYQPSSSSCVPSLFYEQTKVINADINSIENPDSAPISFLMDNEKDEPPSGNLKLNETKKEPETIGNIIKEVYKNTCRGGKNVEKSIKKGKTVSKADTKRTESFTFASTSSAPLLFTSDSTLSHLINVTYNFPFGVKKQPSKQNKFFGCKMCSFSSTSMTKTLEHVKFEHLEERKFPCEFCPQQFFEESDLKLHKTRVHKRVKLAYGIKSKTKTENISESSSSSGLKTHNQSCSSQTCKIPSNEELNPPSEYPPFKKRRQKSSPLPEPVSQETKSILDLHIVSKNDEPPFSCRLCSFRSVISRGNARLHIYETHPQVYNGQP